MALIATKRYGRSDSTKRRLPFCKRRPKPRIPGDKFFRQAGGAALHRRRLRVGHDGPPLLHYLPTARISPRPSSTFSQCDRVPARPVPHSRLLPKERSSSSARPQSRSTLRRARGLADQAGERPNPGASGGSFRVQSAVHKRARTRPAQSDDREPLRAGDGARCQPPGTRQP
jgi:hypothetical protein